MLSDELPSCGGMTECKEEAKWQRIKSAAVRQAAQERVAKGVQAAAGADPKVL